MAVTLGCLRFLNSGRQCSILSNQVSLSGFLKTPTSSPRAATVVKVLVIHARSSSPRATTVIARLGVTDSKFLGGTNPTNGNHSTKRMSEILEGIKFLGGTKTSIARIVNLGGTPSPLHLKGVIKNVTVHPRCAIIKLPV